MNRKAPVRIVHGMLMVSTLLAFATVSTRGADIEDLRRTITAAEQELDNSLSTTKSIVELLASIKADLLSRHADRTLAAIPSTKLLIILAYVDELQTRLDGLSKDTARTSDVLVSISVDVEETGDAALMDAYSKVKRQVVVVYDAIRQARILAYDVTNAIRRMMASTGSDATHMYTPKSN